jgi:hypothetical protein
VYSRQTGFSDRESGVSESAASRSRSVLILAHLSCADQEPMDAPFSGTAEQGSCLYRYVYT